MSEAFHGISMNVYDHIELLLDENVFGNRPDEYLLYNAKTHGAHSPTLMRLLTNVSGTVLILNLADVSGDFAMELETGAVRVLGEASQARIVEIATVKSSCGRRTMTSHLNAC